MVKAKNTPGVGHNSMGAVDRDRLRDIISRIESIEEQRGELASDVKDILAEAKSSGLDPKAIRTIVRMRREDAENRQEREEIVQSYILRRRCDGGAAGEIGC
jgi:uncharacterized protein (UPF0335 family)